MLKTETYLSILLALMPMLVIVIERYRASVAAVCDRRNFFDGSSSQTPSRSDNPEPNKLAAASPSGGGQDAYVPAASSTARLMAAIMLSGAGDSFPPLSKHGTGR